MKMMIPVELCGGPLDGHRDAVCKGDIDALNMHLFERATEGTKVRCAYVWANRATDRGRRWVLEFYCVVSRWSNPVLTGK